jgi:hypothetical protein
MKAAPRRGIHGAHRSFRVRHPVPPGGAHIDVVASELFDARTTLQEGKQLFSELQGMISSEALAVLNRFYETLVKHEEKFEHAAYLVGLQAATGRVQLAAALLTEREEDRSPGQAR